MDANTLIKQYYSMEAATVVSPHGLRRQIELGTNNSCLVDLRSPAEYQQAHIVTAVNIPAYSDPDTAVYHEKERIVSEFRALDSNKEIIVYCYSKACMTGKKIGALLADNDIFVKHLGIGWNEWRHNWQSWNHEHEWEGSKVENYISSGKTPGEFSGEASEISCAC